MLLEIIVESPVQGKRRERSGDRRVYATTSLAGRIGRTLQGKPYRGGLEILLPKGWRESGETTDYDQCSRYQFIFP
jgi:hypothetical protein